MRPRSFACFAAPLVGACARPPQEQVTWREQWELLVTAHDGSLVDARVTVGNTGILAGQGRVHLDRWHAGESPINFARLAGPDETGVWDQRERVRVGPDRLSVEEQGWTLRVSDAETSAVMHLQAVDAPGVAAATAAAAGGAWTLAAPLVAGDVTGWIEAGQRGGAVDGAGILLYRSGTALPVLRRRSLYVLGGGDTSIGLDEQGGVRLAWARVGGEDLDADGARLVEDGDGGLVLELGAAGLRARLVPRTSGGLTRPTEHLSWPEARLAALAGGDLVRRVTLLQAVLTRGGREERAPAVLVEVAPEGALLPLRAPKRVR